MESDRFTRWRTRFTLRAANAVARLSRAPRKGASAPGSYDAVERVLVIELWNIGDVILAMPFLASLPSCFPRAKVTLLARTFAPELLDKSGLIDDFIPADLDWGYGWRLGWPHRVGRVWNIARELRRRKFDLVFSARQHARERVLVALSGAKRRVGFSFGVGDNALTDIVALPRSNRTSRCWSRASW